MNPLRSICLMACLLAVAAASSSSSSHNLKNWKPSEWLSSSEIRELPSADELEFERLEKMPLKKGAKMLEQMYHLAQMNRYDDNFRPTFVPSTSQVPVKIYKPNRSKVTTTLNKLVSTAEQTDKFCADEVTLLITGLPQNLKDADKAYDETVSAFLTRYAHEEEQKVERKWTESYENQSGEKRRNPNRNTGTLVHIQLGEAVNSFERQIFIDTEETGKKLGDIITEMSYKVCDPSTIKIVAQGIAAPVAGAAARQYSANTRGLKLEHIIAAGPSKVFAKQKDTLVGLARGDAKRVEAIHAAPYGMGTIARVGDADFFVDGVTADTPGAKNVIQAAVLPLRLLAESVIPGNEHDFPALATNSMKDYEENRVYGSRAYMGYATNANVKGDFMLKVNEQAPFGRRAAAKRLSSMYNMERSFFDN